MKMIVKSSNIYSVDYDEGTMILRVVFNNGSKYDYYSVPRSAYSNLTTAPSVGKYLNEWIKNKYKCKKVVDE